jgi:NADPH:quinone reductase-like Zn-dependent oxidoreductase
MRNEAHAGANAEPRHQRSIAPHLMRAAVVTRYGPPEVLDVREVERPSAGEGDVLIRVHATTVTAADYRLRALNMPAGMRLMGRLAIGVRKPRKPILGQVVSGVVEKVGAGVDRFHPGDEVFGLTPGGGYADYVAVNADGPLALKPEGLTHGEAAALPFGGHTALHFLRKGRIRKGERIAVYGASGDVGTAAVQLAKHLGATVTAVCSGRNIERIRSLGADIVLDYTTDTIPPAHARYNVVMETVGKTSYSRWKGAMAPGARFLMIAGGVPEYLRMIPTNLFGDHRIIAGVAGADAESMEFLGARAEAGELRPVIERTYPLDRIVEAHRHADTGRKVGSVVIEL